MLIGRIEKSTRTLGAPSDTKDCNPLAVRDVMLEDGHYMISAWEPTPAELEALNKGGTVKLWIRGPYHPVVMVTAGDLPA